MKSQVCEHVCFDRKTNLNEVVRCGTEKDPEMDVSIHEDPMAIRKDPPFQPVQTTRTYDDHGRLVIVHNVYQKVVTKGTRQKRVAPALTK